MKKGPAKPTSSAMTRPVQTQPTTPAICVENERTSVVAQATPLPTYEQQQQVPLAPEKPQVYTGSGGFPGVQVQLVKAERNVRGCRSLPGCGSP